MSTLPPLARVPLLVLGLVSLLTGVFAGLARLGVEVPALAAVHAGNHAALMICAFFGTVICLERAVALGGLWPYAGPATAGAGGVLLLAGGPLPAAQFLFVFAAATLLGGGIVVVRRQFALFTVMLAVGAACWLLGTLVWWAGDDVHAAVPLWLAFLVLTIAGERLELTRFLPARPAAAPSFVAVSALILAGAVLAPMHEDLGHGLFAAGVLAMAAWLLTFDIARHNARQQGLTRFIAVCLLSGYVWLAFGALAALGGGLAPASSTARHHHARDRARLRVLDGVRPRRDHLPGGAEGEDPLPPGLLRAARAAARLARAARGGQPARASRVAQLGRDRECADPRGLHRHHGRQRDPRRTPAGAPSAQGLMQHAATPRPITFS
jgi:hypothetical protein